MEAHTITDKGFKFKIFKEAHDPITNRLSVGGSKDQGCYLVFRGDINDCLEVLEEAVEAFKKAKAIYLTQQN